MTVVIATAKLTGPDLRNTNEEEPSDESQTSNNSVNCT